METNPQALLAELRAWGTPGYVWTNHDGERWWFKQVWWRKKCGHRVDGPGDGIQGGVQECCEELFPCDQHKPASLIDSAPSEGKP